MRQAKIREKAAKVAENDPFGAVDEQLDKSAASEAVNSDALAQVTAQGWHSQGLYQGWRYSGVMQCGPSLISST